MAKLDLKESLKALNKKGCFAPRLIEDASIELSRLQTANPDTEFVPHIGTCSSIMRTNSSVKFFEGQSHTGWSIYTIIAFRMPTSNDIAQGHHSIIKEVVACPNLSGDGRCNLIGPCHPVGGVQPRSSIKP